MITWILGLASVLIISAISLTGLLVLYLGNRRLEKIILYLVSFSVGGLFGDAFIHLIPEAIEEGSFGISVSLLILFGILFSFVAEKFLQWRHCHIPTSKEHPHSFAYMNLFGDAVHNLIDGLIVGGSYMVSIPIGLSTTLAVIFHEIPQELGDFGVLIHGGFERKKAVWFNLLTAFTAVLGAMIAFFASTTLEGFIPLLIPFAAGNFIYIAGSDLIPELREDEPNLKKSALQVVSIILGVAVMLLVLLLE